MKGADRGSGRGPCTVQVILSPDDDRDESEARGNAACGSYSRYAEPEADGVTPVLRTNQKNEQFVRDKPPFLTYISFARNLLPWFASVCLAPQLFRHPSSKILAV